MNPMKQSKELQDDSLHLEIDTSTIPSQVREGMVGHNWKQVGFTLICQSCPCQHSVNIGKRIYQGLDDNGNPILKKID